MGGDGDRCSGGQRSPLAAALLNLTGLALGYAYLRRWRRAALHLGISVGLVVIAFATDAASLPWLWRALVLGWLGWMVFDGWRLAGAGSRLPRNQAIRTVTGPYELTLSRDVPAAAANQEQCVAFQAASRAEASGAYADAVSRYRDYRRTYPATVLAPFVQENLKRSYAALAGSLRSSRDYPAAIRVYRDLLAEPGSAEVRGELAATYFEQAEAARAGIAAGSPLNVEIMR